MKIKPDQLNIAERMAIEVLRGDLASAAALADQLCEMKSVGAIQLTPAVNRLNVSVDRLRVICYTHNYDPALEVDIDNHGLTNSVINWLRNGQEPLILVGVDRVEIWELPEEKGGQT